MPDPNDNTLEIETGEEMPEPSQQAMNAHEQNMMQLSQSGVIAQNNFITTTKAQDLDYLEGKRMVSLEEAIGVREVASKTSPGGPSPA